VTGIKNTNGTWHKGQTKRLLGNSVPAIYTFYSTVIKLDRYLNILSYLHFTDNSNEPWFEHVIFLTQCGYEACLKFKIAHLPNVMTILKIWLWRNDCFIQTEGDFQREHTKEMQTFHHPSLQTFWLDWINVRLGSILGKDRQSKAQHVTATNVRWQNWWGRHMHVAIN
jgi:hypothetical protein